METKNEFQILSDGLQRTLNAHSKPVMDAIAQIERTGSLLDDYVAPVSSIKFINDPDPVNATGVRMFMPDVQTDHGTFSLHPFAVGQIGEKLAIPPAYLKTLVTGEKWQRELSVDIMDQTAVNSKREKVLLRTIDGQLRGFLSDKYRRLNSMEIFVAFLTAAKSYDSILVDAHAGETKGFLEVINPKIVEFDTPLNGRNYAVFGARIRNSDFGDGALAIWFFMINVRCMNGMIGNTMLRDVHIGGRIPDNIQISDDTYKKDTIAKAALTRDIMKQLYSPETMDGMITRIQGASAKLIDIPAEIERLPKLGFTIGETEMVAKKMMDNDPADGLIGSPTLWKLVNGMTAVARDAKPERKRDLEEIASAMLK